MEIPIAVLDEEFEDLDGHEDLGALLVFEDLLEDGDDVFGAEVGVVDDFYHPQDVVHV